MPVVWHVISSVLFRILYLQRDLLQKLNPRSLEVVPRDGVLKMKGLRLSGPRLPCMILIFGDELVHFELCLTLNYRSCVSGC